MKNILTTLILLGLMMMGSAINSTLTAQNMEGDFVVGGGLVYGTGVFDFGDEDIDIGLQVNGYYSVTPEIRVGGDFTYFFPVTFEFSDEFFGTQVEEEDKYTITEVNINGHYLFVNESDLIVYALAGINIARFSNEYTYTENGFSESESFSDSETGLNLGAGLEYALDFANFYAEAKLSNVGGDLDQFVLGVGLRFKF